MGTGWAERAAVESLVKMGLGCRPDGLRRMAGGVQISTGFGLGNSVSWRPRVSGEHRS